MMTPPKASTVGVLALQGGFIEHLNLLKKAASAYPSTSFTFREVRTPAELAQCDALVIPGGESTTMALVAAQSGLLEPLRDYVKVLRKPVWGTCAGLIILSESANASKKGGQDLVGGLSVRVHRNHFGRQIESFVADLDLPFLSSSSSPPSPSADGRNLFPGVFIRAPVVEQVLRDESVEVLAKLPNRVNKMKEGVSVAETRGDAGDIIAVREGNVTGTSFHPELTSDERMHVWWLNEVLRTQSS